VGAIVIAGLTFGAVPASAYGPYTSGQTGYDVSYPQCPGASAPPGTFNFGIVGVTHGRPFTSNACLGTEYKAAAQFSTPSLYFNTGYSGAYRRNIRPQCSAGPNQAWEIGCSEADYAVSQASGLKVAMWWLDVEVGNSWSTSSSTLNRQTIQGAVDRLSSAGLVGVYSTASSWNTITGGSFSPNGSSADWVAAGSCSTSFDGKPVWLSQFTSSGFDNDTAC